MGLNPREIIALLIPPLQQLLGSFIILGRHARLLHWATSAPPEPGLIYLCLPSWEPGTKSPSLGAVE